MHEYHTDAYILPARLARPRAAPPPLAGLCARQPPHAPNHRRTHAGTSTPARARTSPPAGGVELIKLLLDYGADQDAATPRGWTPLSYARAKGKYGPTEEQGIYPEVGAAAGTG
jgi:hypothetical protein